MDGVIKYHRMFSTIINSLIDVGFVAETMTDALPSTELLAEYPGCSDLFQRAEKSWRKCFQWLFLNQDHRTHRRPRISGGITFEGCTSLESVTTTASCTTFVDNDIFIDCTNLTIKGAAGSAAESYANNSGITFEAIRIQRADIER